MQPAPVSRMVTFVIGLVCGMVVAMLATLTAFLTIDPNVNTIPQFLGAFPVFRGLFLLASAGWLWGGVVAVCERVHINHRFVIDADPRTALTAQQIFLLSSLLMVIIVFSLLLYVSLVVYTDALAGILHLVMFLALVVMAVWPFRHLVYDTRAWLWRTLRDALIAPFISVTFRAAFVADFLTSLVRSIQGPYAESTVSRVDSNSIFISTLFFSISLLGLERGADLTYSFCFYTTSDFYSVDPHVRAYTLT